MSSNKLNQQKKSSGRLNTETNYIPCKTEKSQQKNYLSSQGTTGVTKYIQSEQILSQKLIHKDRASQKIKKKTENKLYDLNCTLKINMKLIEDFIKSGQISKLNNQQIKKLQNKIEIISKLISVRQSLKKEKENANGKKLVNTQIFQEVKSRKEENLNLIKETCQEYIGLSKKKDITIRKCHKKFNEIQIYIRRESQSFPKYKRIYGNYSIDNFILENENMLRLKEKLKNLIIQKNKYIPILLKEIDEMKKNKYKNDINPINQIKIGYNNYEDNFEDKKDAQNKLNSFLLIGEDILKNLENKNLQIEQIFNKLTYKCYKNYYNNVLKYYTLINKDFSKSQISQNLISGINPQNTIDNNETNISNIFFDIMDISNNKSTFKNEDLSNILNSRFI